MPATHRKRKCTLIIFSDDSAPIVFGQESMDNILRVAYRELHNFPHSVNIVRCNLVRRRMFIERSPINYNMMYYSLLTRIKHGNDR